MDDAMLMSTHELASAVHALSVFDSGTKGFASVCLDSRKVAASSLFVALPGERVDGHEYLNAAFTAGASMALVNESFMHERGDWAMQVAREHNASLLVVPNTLLALQSAAKSWLGRFSDLLKIGITGSSGKTTVKELCAAMLSREFSVVMNEGNLNSDSGLPLSVFSVRKGHQVGVFEMGMNRQGEMAELASVFSPELALITNIGTAHIGILGTQDAIAEEKKQIFSCFDGSQIAFVDEDELYGDFLLAGLHGTAQRYGKRSLPQFGGYEDLGLDGMNITWAEKTVRFPVGGEHNLKNALAAAALASKAGASAEAIVDALASYQPLFGRGQILRGELSIVRDCYNANPEAMLAALDWADQIQWAGRKVYIIASMLELGDMSSALHRAIGERLRHCKADLVLVYGDEARPVYEALTDSVDDTDAKAGAFAGSVYHFSDYEELEKTVRTLLGSGDLVLLKGSRGMALERLEASIMKTGRGA